MSLTAGIPTNGLAALDRYLELKTQIAELERELKQLQPALVEAVSLQGGKVLQGECEICVRQRVTFDYSHDVVNAYRALKEMKREEERTGVAKVRTLTEFLRVRHL